MLTSAVRVLMFLLLVAAGVWVGFRLVEDQGGITIQFSGQEYFFLPVHFAALLLIGFIALWLTIKIAGFILAVLRFIDGDETAISRFFNRSRERRGLEALARGMAALAAGDPRVARAKAEIFSGLKSGGAAILNRDNEHYRLLCDEALEQGAHIVRFGEDERADVRLLDVVTGDDGSDVSASLFGELLDYHIGAPGRHFVMNSLGVLACVRETGGDLFEASAAFGALSAPRGRGERRELITPEGSLLLIDESYNANPLSMGAALETLGRVARADYPRRIAVLGDMLELGSASRHLHGALSGPVEAAGTDLVFACGPHMAELYEKLPETRRGGYDMTSEQLVAKLLAEVRAGDVVMIKGSLGSAMAVLVDALSAQYRDKSGSVG